MRPAVRGGGCAAMASWSTRFASAVGTRRVHASCTGNSTGTIRPTPDPVRAEVRTTGVPGNTLRGVDDEEGDVRGLDGLDGSKEPVVLDPLGLDGPAKAGGIDEADG